MHKEIKPQAPLGPGALKPFLTRRLGKLSYFLFRLIVHPLPMLKVLVAVIIIGYAYTNIYKFLTFEQRALAYYKIETIRRVNAGEKIEFFEGSPESYLYYLYKERYER